MIKLFTDTDLDGVGCGIIAKLAFGEEADVSYCSYKNLNERVKKFIEDPASDNAHVYITDLAVNSDIEKRLEARFNSGKHVQMVDHHVTALHFNSYKWGLVQAEYDTNKKTSATSLFYDFLLNKELMKPNPSLEQFIELVRQYDTWEWEVNKNTDAKRLNDLFFIIGIDTFEKEMLERLTKNQPFTLSDTEEMILDVEENKIERYIHSKNRQMVQRFVDDICVGIVNAEQYLSELGNALAKLNPHLDLIALVNVGTKKIGFRTIYDHIDVSQFAKRFGGGGHPKASGCSLTEETFDLFVKDVFMTPPINRDAVNNELNKKEAAYGSLFVNKKAEKTFVFPNRETNTWEIVHDGKRIEQQFTTFNDAEMFLKRQFAAGLAFDHTQIKYMQEILKKNEKDIRENFEECMKKWKEKLEK